MKDTRTLYLVASTTEQSVTGVLFGVTLRSIVVDSGQLSEYDCSRSAAIGAAHLLNKRVVVTLKRSRVTSIGRAPKAKKTAEVPRG